MGIRKPRRSWTYDDFAALPGKPGERVEVLDGDLVVTPSPTPRHQLVIGRLHSLLAPYVERHGLGWVLAGPVDVLFSQGDYAAPDLVFVRRDRKHIVGERGLEGSPDLLVEVLSPSTASRDRGRKRERYGRFGVPEYWVVDPEHQRIEVYGPQKLQAPPNVVTETLHWSPADSVPPLEIPVGPTLAGFDEAGPGG